jgi:hypothetical protein
MTTLGKILIGIVIGPPLALLLALAIATPFLAAAKIAVPVGAALGIGPWPIFIVAAVAWAMVLKVVHERYGRSALSQDEE